MEDLIQRRLRSFLAIGPNRSIISLDDVSLGSTIGRVREENQDRGIVVKSAERGKPRQTSILVIVCDGIGGMSKGGLAASIATSVFASTFLKTSRLGLRERLDRAAREANAVVFSDMSGGSGTTLSAFSYDGREMAAVNVGDSRLYGFTRGKQLLQLSKDDILGNILNREAVGIDQANRLVQYIGMGDGLLPHVIPINRVDFDQIFITTDGVHSSFGNIGSRIINSTKDISHAVRECITLSEITGGSDNATVAAIDVQRLHPLDPVFDGLSIEIAVPSSKLEIWMPTTPPSDYQPDIAGGGDAKRSQKKQRTPKRSGGKKSSSSKENLALPLIDDDIDVSFPEAED